MLRKLNWVRMKLRPSSLFSGNAPIVTAPASEDEDVAKDVVEDENDDEEMVVQPGGRSAPDHARAGQPANLE